MRYTSDPTASSVWGNANVNYFWGGGGPTKQYFLSERGCIEELNLAPGPQGQFPSGYTGN